MRQKHLHVRKSGGRHTTHVRVVIIQPMLKYPQGIILMNPEYATPADILRLDLLLN